MINQLRNVSLILLLFMTESFRLVSAQENIFQINYQLDIKKEKHGGGEFKMGDVSLDPSSENLIIQLNTDGGFTTSTQKNEYTRYDFIKEMIYNYNQDTLKSIIPLYSVVDFRIAEYHNRVAMTEVLQAGGVDNPMGDLMNLESVFGLEFPENNLKDSIEVKSKGNTKVYSFEGNDLVQVHFSKTKISDEFAESFTHFLTYLTEIHPSIKRAIIETHLIPEYLEYSFINVGTKSTKTYILNQTRQFANKKVDLPGDLILGKRNSPPIARLIDSVFNYTMMHDIPAIDTGFYFKEYKKLLQTNENLSSLLSLFEYLLSSGDQPVEQLREVAQRHDSDTLLATFLSCMGMPKSKEEAEQKIAELKPLIALDVKYGYVMNIFVANYIEPIDRIEAISRFQKALSHQPMITGAWHDLGNIYAGMYQYNDAWKCYEIMRRINTNHPMSKELLEKKASLKQKHPEYFNSK